MSNAIRTVLFDLDGTLLDTAPDLTWAVNCLLEADGRPPRSEAEIRPYVSRGARAIIRYSFEYADDEPRLELLRMELTNLYGANIADRTRLFSGMEQVLAYIEDKGANWGVVTNKPAFLTEPLLSALGLSGRAVTIVSGDTTDNSKPHPEPVLHACAEAGSEPAECVFVGDDPRDIEAGQAAGMPALVAMFGYLAGDADPYSWGADGYLDCPADLIEWMEERG